MKIFLWAPKTATGLLFPLEKVAGLLQALISCRALLATSSFFIFLLICAYCLTSPTRRRTPREWKPFLVYSLWRLQKPTVCLAHSRCSINICRTNKWRRAYLFKQVFISELVVPCLPRWIPQKAGSSPWHLIALLLTCLVTMPHRCYILMVSRICPLASILCSLLPCISLGHTRLFNLQSCLLQPSLQPATSVIF